MPPDRAWPDRREGDDRAAAIEYRIGRLEQARARMEAEQQDLRKTVDRWVPVVESLSTEDKIRAGVAQALKSQDTRFLTRRQELVALGGLFCLLATTVIAAINLIILGAH